MVQVFLSTTLEKHILQWLSHNQTSQQSKQFQAQLRNFCLEEAWPYRNMDYFMWWPFSCAGVFWFWSCTSSSLPLSLCLLHCARAPPRSEVRYRPRSHFCRGRRVTRINSHFFLATCHFSPGMEKAISFPCTPPYWEQRSSFPLRGKVPLPFFTGWTSANENHYWVHSIYLSGDILADFF